MCKHNGETTDHLLLHCEAVTDLWDDIFTRLGLAWVMPRKVIDLLACWRVIRGKGQIADIWKMVPLCLMRCTWNERNNRCFERKERSPGGFRDFFYHTLVLWASSILMNGTSFTELYAALSL
ncbi:hypothetical protein I3843_12G099400 [Carya illinoinensis]|uniref:Reverse transcriptase zinc-binding domain-containing protein n=1 Tax=Carya illinoinensis TaxID=32201 RepID=A0A922IW62_CARIL|nr:hypothetical protein I3760_12G097500 [Carya illinoinensis]KAG6685176.1 hypothetical protein I3842_12G098900 [Carya illinoinensis]KAG7953236.1 hypothetical protein I3843_12G099400 [Carya illinoinensis]